MKEKPFYTINDLAEFGISRSRWYAFARQGLVSFRKLGGRTVILRDELDRFLGSLPEQVVGESVKVPKHA